MLLPEIRALLFSLLAENPTAESGGQFIFFSDMAPEKPCSDYVLTLYFKKAIESAGIDIARSRGLPTLCEKLYTALFTFR